MKLYKTFLVTLFIGISVLSSISFSASISIDRRAVYYEDDAWVIRNQDGAVCRFSVHGFAYSNSNFAPYTRKCQDTECDVAMEPKAFKLACNLVDSTTRAHEPITRRNVAPFSNPMAKRGSDGRIYWDGDDEWTYINTNNDTCSFTLETYDVASSPLSPVCSYCTGNICHCDDQEDDFCGRCAAVAPTAHCTGAAGQSSFLNSPHFANFHEISGNKRAGSEQRFPHGIAEDEEDDYDDECDDDDDDDDEDDDDDDK